MNIFFLSFDLHHRVVCTDQVIKNIKLAYDQYKISCNHVPNV